MYTKNLIDNLFSLSVINDSSISSTAKSILAQRNKIAAAATTQEEKIVAFWGGTLYAMYEDEVRYREDFGIKAIIGKIDLPTDCTAAIIAIGKYVVENLPDCLTAELFDKTIQTDYQEYKGKPFFPQLSNNKEKVTQLIHFCSLYKNNLEVPFLLSCSPQATLLLGMFGNGVNREENEPSDLTFQY